MAYDFEVDGIYYNITSTTTVEVTYKDTNYASYSGNMTIPCAVTCNDKTYTVTAIGDYAFYNSEGTYKLTIPETVLSIGECAFYGCHPNSTTCLAIEAPTLNNSFDTQREWRFDYWFTSDTSYVLYVKPEAYMNYSGWRAFFNHIIIQDEYLYNDGTVFLGFFYDYGDDTEGDGIGIKITEGEIKDIGYISMAF